MKAGSSRRGILCDKIIYGFSSHRERREEGGR